MIFLIFQITIGHHVQFLKRKILFAMEVWRIEAHNDAKFCRNWSIHCGDIAVFKFCKMAAAVILNFRNCNIFSNGLKGQDTSPFQILST